jgi:hypothetical protein
VLRLSAVLWAEPLEMSFITELQSTTGRPGGPTGLWLLVPSDVQHQKPMLDGQPVPDFARGQWARVPDGWLAAFRNETIVAKNG